MNAFASANPAKNTMECEGAEPGEAWRCEKAAEERERLERARQEAPDNGELCLALGHLEMCAGNFEAALADYASAATLLPKSAAAQSSLALALQKLGRSNEAAQAAIRALALDANDTTGLKVLARIHLDAGQHEAAQKACRQILRHHRHEAEAGQMLGEALAQKAKLAENLFDTRALLMGRTAVAEPPRIAPRREKPPKSTARTS
jgi:tetratricopeptide (TPR) repeat protein